MNLLHYKLIDFLVKVPCIKSSCFLFFWGENVFLFKLCFPTDDDLVCSAHPNFCAGFSGLG
jgi:hypothetical protein